MNDSENRVYPTDPLMNGFIVPTSTQNLEMENLKTRVKMLEKILSNKILLVEDGSVDVDKLEADGFYVIVYRNGANPPQWLKKEISNE